MDLNGSLMCIDYSIRPYTPAFYYVDSHYVNYDRGDLVVNGLHLFYNNIIPIAVGLIFLVMIYRWI